MRPRIAGTVVLGLLQVVAGIARLAFLGWLRSYPRGTLKMPTFPVRFDGATPRVTPAPLLGEHNTTVLGDWLGMKTDDVEALTRDGVL